MVSDRVREGVGADVAGRGVYVKLPVVAKSEAGVMVPPWAVVVDATDHVFVSPATGLSLPLTLRVPEVVSSLTLNASAFATGAIGATVSVTVVVDVWPE